MPKLIYHDSDGVDKVINLGSDPLLIGRAAECQVQTQDAMVSRRHARIIWDGNYWIEDLGSSNGVYVGNEKVQRAPVRPGDTVTCGSLVLRLMPDTRPSHAQVPGSAPTPMAGSPALPPPPVAPPPPTPRPPPLAAPPPAAPAYVASPSPSMGGAQPTMLPPPAAPPPAGHVQVGPNAVLRGAVSPSNAVTGAQGAQILVELDREKKRRADAEEALLAAAERVKVAETRATELEAAAKESNLLKRKVDQLTADLRRLRGGRPEEPPPEAARDEGDRQARLAAESERDALQLKVAELERRLTGASTAPADPEKDKLRRQVEQLTAELRRVRTGPAGPSADAARIAELTEQLQQAEARAATPKADPETADAAILLSDSLAELRSSLRAANDEAGLLTTPPESVAVVADALRTAADQLESARTALRNLAKRLGV